MTWVAHRHGVKTGFRRILGRGWFFALWLLMLVATPESKSQSFFLTLTNTPDPILVGSNIIYSLSVSNATGFNLNPGVITSEYDDNAEFVSATNLFGYTNNAPGRVVFMIPESAFPKNGVIHVLLELRGTNVGMVTNTFTVAIDDGGQTTPAITNAISSIELPPEADLSISIIGPKNGVFPGDPFEYQLLANNAGPGGAQGVVVSNKFPENVSLQQLSPSNSVHLTNGYVLFTVGSLTNLESATATVSVLATNAATTNLISATISANDLVESNLTNNSFTLNVPILSPDTNQIIVTGMSAQQLNQQTGWMEQQVILQNIGTSTVESVRLLVDGLTNQLVNATGTNGFVPYVTSGLSLEPGKEVALILEYNNPSRQPGANPSFTAYGTPALVLTPLEGTPIAIDRILQISNGTLNQGRVLLEWPAEEGSRFQVIFDDQVDFEDANGSLPLIVVPASVNRVQWLDYGPPKTLSAPGNTISRFYKVIEVP